MAAISTATLLLLFLPFLLSLAGQGFMAKMLSMLSLLLTVEPERAALAWIVGMIIALVSIWERIRQRFPV
jgi:hypothetical protein